MNYPLHCTVTYNNLIGSLYKGMRAVAEDALPSRICHRGGGYDCYVCYVLIKISRTAPLSAPLEPFSEK